jgi:Trypsin-like peptidase domain
VNKFWRRKGIIVLFIVAVLALLNSQSLHLFSPVFGFENSSSLSSEPQSLQDLFESEYAILRLRGNQVNVAGVGFVIKQAPIRIFTCNHVVSEGTEQNNGPVVYAIARRIEPTNDIDIRKTTFSYLRIKRIVFKPEYDIAVLEIDPKIDEPIAERLRIGESKPLTLNLDSSQRSIGSAVTWLTTAAQGDLTLTPRVFTGNIVANYITNEKYSYSSSGQMIDQVISGARMLEIDKLFLPGASGSPILNSGTKQVIGYVHGYRAFALNSNIDVTEEVEMGDATELRGQRLKYKPPLVTSVSLGIDLRTAGSYLVGEGYVPE